MSHWNEIILMGLGLASAGYVCASILIKVLAWVKARGAASLPQKDPEPVDSDDEPSNLSDKAADALAIICHQSAFTKRRAIEEALDLALMFLSAKQKEQAVYVADCRSNVPLYELAAFYGDQGPMKQSDRAFEESAAGVMFERGADRNCFGEQVQGRDDYVGLSGLGEVPEAARKPPTQREVDLIETLQNENQLLMEIMATRNQEHFDNPQEWWYVLGVRIEVGAAGKKPSLTPYLCMWRKRDDMWLTPAGETSPTPERWFHLSDGFHDYVRQLDCEKLGS